MAAPTIGSPDPYSLSRNIDRQAEIARGFANTTVSALNAATNAKAVMEQVETSRANRAKAIRDEQRQVSLKNKRAGYRRNYYSGGLDYRSALETNRNVYGDNRAARLSALRNVLVEAGDDEVFLSNARAAMQFLNEDDYDSEKFDNMMNSMARSYNIENDARFDLVDEYVFFDRNGLKRSIFQANEMAVDRYRQEFGVDLKAADIQSQYDDMNKEQLKFAYFPDESIQAQSDLAAKAGDIAKFTTGTGTSINVSSPGPGSINLSQKAKNRRYGNQIIPYTQDLKKQNDLQDDLEQAAVNVLKGNNLLDDTSDKTEIEEFYKDLGKTGKGADFLSFAGDLGMREATGLLVLSELLNEKKENLTPTGEYIETNPIKAKIAERVKRELKGLMDAQQLPQIGEQEAMGDYIQRLIDDRNNDQIKNQLKRLGGVSMEVLNEATDIEINPLDPGYNEGMVNFFGEPVDKTALKNGMKDLLKDSFGRPFDIHLAQIEDEDLYPSSGAPSSRAGGSERSNWTGIGDPNVRRTGELTAQEALNRATKMSESNMRGGASMFLKVPKRYNERDEY